MTEPTRMKEPSALDKKVVTEIMQFLARMGTRLERDFPKYREQIARAFIITGATWLQNEHGAEAAGDALFHIGAALEGEHGDDDAHHGAPPGMH